MIISITPTTVERSNSVFPMISTHLEKQRVRDAALERSMVWVFEVVQRVDKGRVLPVNGALGSPKLTKVVRDVLEKDPDHQHAKQGRQHDVHPHQLAQKAAKKFDAKSTWIISLLLWICMADQYCS